MEKKRTTLDKIIYFLSLIAFGVFAFVLFNNNILPLNYRLILVGIIGLAYLITLVILTRKTSGKAAKTVLSILLLLGGIGFALASYYVQRGVDTIKEINKVETVDTMDYSLVVRKDSSINRIDDINGQDIYGALDRDKENLDLFKEQVEKDLKIVNGGDYASIAKQLLENQVDIMVLSESFRPIIEDQLQNFSDDTKVVYTHTVTKEIAVVEPETVEEEPKEDDLTEPAPKRTEGAFNIYISGIDTYGALSTVSRSDVNILMTVNPKTHKILMTTVPRDSYLPIAGGGQGQMDKLTHAGIYGVNSSMQTIANALNTQVDYYARVNFSSLIRMVDVLGGIQVYSPVAIQTGNISVSQGNNYMNGTQALAFARERYHLAGGDFDRGRNQMRVIEGIINKAMSPSILLNYNSVLGVVLDSMQTSMPYDEIINQINRQISSGSGWTIEKQDITGYGSSGLPSYAMPGWNLYMFVPDQGSLANASQAINRTLSE